MSQEDRRFPNEPTEYRARREELCRAEADLRNQVERVAALRRELPLGGKVQEDYVFERMGPDGSAEPVRLSELFSPGKNTLVAYSYMFGPAMEAPCPMCTSLIDGFDAQARQVLDRVGFVVVAKSPIERIMAFATARGWSRVPLLSSSGNSYNADYRGEDAEENQTPMINVFVRRADGIYHYWGSEPGGQPRLFDLLWPLWNILDLTPEGRGTDWYPKLEYV